MEWVREHIAGFGGDPSLVTLFGESSGAASIGYHMMSDRSAPLFTRAIYESGSPDSHWSYMTRRQARERSRDFLRAVNCTQDDQGALLACLRAHPADFLLNNEWVRDVRHRWRVKVRVQGSKYSEKGTAGVQCVCV